MPRCDPTWWTGAGTKRLHPREAGGARQYPYNGKRARTERGEGGRPWFAEIVDDSGKRTKVGVPGTD